MDVQDNSNAGNILLEDIIDEEIKCRFPLLKTSFRKRDDIGFKEFTKLEHDVVAKIEW
jgi:hypothetical protein